MANNTTNPRTRLLTDKWNQSVRLSIWDLSIKWKIFLPLIFIFFIASFIQFFISLNTMRNNLASELSSKGVLLAKTLSFSIAEPLSLGVIQNIQYQIKSVQEIEKELQYIRVIDLIGSVKASVGSQKNETVISTYELQRMNTISTIKYFFDNKNKLFSLQMPIYVSEGENRIKIGFLQFALTTRFMEETKHKLTLLSLTNFIFLLFLATLIFNYITNKIILSPIKGIEATVIQVSNGNLDDQIPVSTNDELGYFANTFNQMISNLKEARLTAQTYLNELTTHKEKLEFLVHQRTAELEEKNKEILEGIKYAATIQAAILPKKDFFSKYFRESFIMWNPKDMVGGDIYWAFDRSKHFILDSKNTAGNDDIFLLAVIDCIGHGVPAGFMTMTVNSLLNEITDRYSLTDPSLILHELDRLLRLTLSQNEAKYISDEGLDIGLCCVEPEQKTLTYSGARISLFHINNDNIQEIKGDRLSVGYNRPGKTIHFTNHIIHDTNDTTFYLASDGYIEQYGGEKEIPFGKNRLKKILLENYQKPFLEQKQILDAALHQYKNVHPQIDDITMLGFRL